MGSHSKFAPYDLSDRLPQDRNRTVLTAHGVGLAAVAKDLRSAPAAAALRRIDVSNNSLTSLGGLLTLGASLSF